MNKFGGSQSSSKFGANQPYKIPQRRTPSSPPKPETLFGKKKEYERQEFLKKVAKDPIPFSGKWEDQRRKMFSEAFPEKRFGSYISEKETKQKLRELRKEGYKAKALKGALEKQTGLKGKY